MRLRRGGLCRRAAPNDTLHAAQADQARDTIMERGDDSRPRMLYIAVSLRHALKTDCYLVGWLVSRAGP